MRCYGPMRSSPGTVIPLAVRKQVQSRDGGCVGPRVGMPGDCAGSLEQDHVRASHGIGMKSESTTSNLVVLCGTHHRLKTEYGRDWRPKLIAYLAKAAEQWGGPK